MIRYKEDYDKHVLAERLWELSQEAFDYGSPWQVAQFLADIENPSSYYLLVEKESKIVAYLIFHLVLDEAEVINIATIPAYKGKNAAQELLSQGLSKMAFLGIRIVFLDVRETNYPAIGLYLKVGFKEIGRRKAYYHQPKEDGLVMSWEASDWEQIENNSKKL